MASASSVALMRQSSVVVAAALVTTVDLGLRFLRSCFERKSRSAHRQGCRWPSARLNRNCRSVEDYRHLLEGVKGRFELRLGVPYLAKPRVVDQHSVGPDSDQRHGVLGQGVPDRAAVKCHVGGQLDIVVGVADPGNYRMTVEQRLIDGGR